VHAFLEGKSQRGDVVMFERHAAHLEQRCFQQHSLRSRGSGERLALEAARATQLRALPAPPAVDLVSDDDEFGLVILDQIPCVRRELVFEVCYEFLRSVQTYAPVAPQTDAQQVIKTGEVIHVRVRNEYVAHSQELPRWQNGDIADIEKHRAAFKFEVDKDPGIAEGPVDEFREREGFVATPAGTRGTNPQSQKGSSHPVDPLLPRAATR
jgi:hypothetical protein